MRSPFDRPFGIRSPFGSQSGSPLSISYSALEFETGDQPYTVEGAELISVADTADTGLAEYEITLEIGSPGTLTLSQTTGLSFTVGDGTADTIMTFSGTTANINAALDGLIIDDMTESSDPLTVLLSNTTTSDEITRLVPIEVTAPSTVPSVEYLVVGGGGGGGAQVAGGYAPGGGGAGGYRTATGYAVSAGSPITVTVGSGGAGGTAGASGTKGSDSVFGTITSEGGGYGARGSVSTAASGGNGGSGGGGCRAAGTGGTASNGNAGGAGEDGGAFSGGAGGGAGGAGQSGGDVAGTPAGGAGLNWNSLGTTYAVGGAGGNYVASEADGSDAAANTGNGGGAALGPAARPGGDGGSGIVIIRYADTYPAAASTTGTPNVTTAGGYRYYTWTSSGSITF